jgi:hypothetical protein
MEGRLFLSKGDLLQVGFFQKGDIRIPLMEGGSGQVNIL